MESTVIWVLIFSGAAIGLLGIFLAASERELKRKRRQLEELTAQLSDSSTPQRGTSHQSVADNSSDLATANAELSQRIADLRVQLQNTQDQARRLQDSQSHLSSLEMEAAELRSSNQRLQQENLELKEQLLATQAYPEESRETSDNVEHSSWLEDEMHELQEKLKNSEARVRELELAELAGSQSGGSSSQEDRSDWEAHIDELESELARAKEKLSEFDTMDTRLREIQRLYWESEDHNSRLQEEMRRWREQSARDEGERFSLVRRHINDLAIKQAALAEQHRRLQEEMAAIGDLIEGGSHPSAQPTATVFQNVPNRFEADEEFDQADGVPEESVLQKPNEDSQSAGPLEENDFTPIATPQPPTPDEPVTTRRASNGASYKTLVVMVPVLLVVGTLVAGYLRKHSPEAELSAEPASSTVSVRPMEQPPALPAATTSNPGASASALTSKQSAPRNYESNAGSEPQVNTISTAAGERDRRIPEPSAAQLKTTSPLAADTANKASPRAWGAYEVTRATEVYSEPTESSQRVGNLDSGTHVNVVGSRDGWLEIRPKNGRPPGFIKNDAAVRAGRN
jgi:hypothetical protein